MPQPEKIFWFFVMAASVIGCLSQHLSKGSAIIRRYRCSVISAVFLAFATLVVIAAVKGHQILLIPNGTFFENPNGASETYSTVGGAST